MYINAMGHYVPSQRVDNDYFLDINGLTADWILQRTGIRTRSKCADGENQNTMAMEAIEDAMRSLPYDIKDVDLIVGAAYAAYDTVATVGHQAQRQYDIDGAKVLYLTSACSSFINGLEVVETYFAAGKATKALLICSEHNTYYSNESDPKAGHLWETVLWHTLSRKSALRLPTGKSQQFLQKVSAMWAKGLTGSVCVLKRTA